MLYPPTSSPELNPEDLLNAELKQAVSSRARMCTNGALCKAAISCLRRLHKLPERIRRYFMHATVRYAA